MRVLLVALLLLPCAARAGWYEASSAHFVIYADASQKEVQRLSERLERYHAALEKLTGVHGPAPSPSNRLTIYMVRNGRDVRSVFGDDGRYVGGFYIPRAGASLAVVPRVHAGLTVDSIQILLHEYAHHFLVSHGHVSLPRWVSEGAAEFFSSAAFASDGGIRIGLAAQHRAAELQQARDVPVARLLEPDEYKDGLRKGFDSFYGKSWALFHYLHFGPESRRGQMERYLALLATGEGSVAAGLEAFGDLDQLDREVEQYLKKKTLLAAELSAEMLPIAAVKVRQLGQGEAAIMPLVVRSKRGLSLTQSLELATRARAIAARYPHDAAVLAALAEAEFDAGDYDRAIAAADAALALDPTRVNAYVQKGYALFMRALTEIPDTEADAAWKAAIQPYLALNRIESDHPLPLYYYFLTFAFRDQEPTAQAVRGLERAVELAPFDFTMRMTLARHRVTNGDLPGARSVLLPVAHHPHGGEWARNIREVVQRIDAGGEPKTPELLALLEAEPPQIEGGWR